MNTLFSIDRQKLQAQPTKTLPAATWLLQRNMIGEPSLRACCEINRYVYGESADPGDYTDSLDDADTMRENCQRVPNDAAQEK